MKIHVICRCCLYFTISTPACRIMLLNMIEACLCFGLSKYELLCRSLWWFFIFLLIWALCPCQWCDIIVCMIKYDWLLDRSSFASSVASWTSLPPLRRHQHTCAISGLYGVTGVHSQEAHMTLLNHAASHLKTLISMELVNTLIIRFLLTEILGT
jgi:hypothetical protein